MDQIFNLDNPVMRFMARVADLIAVNILFLLCSLPVVTAGASLAAMNKVTQSMVLDEDAGIVKPFFRAFRDNFKQATPVWLILLLFFAGAGANVVLAMAHLTGFALSLALWVLGILSVVVLAAGCYYFPLIVRYTNSVKQHLNNAILLSLAKLPRTLEILVLTALPLILYLAVPDIFWHTSIFWILVGFAACSYLCEKILKPVFAQMENKDTPDKTEVEEGEAQ